jgi:hypothetical protein
MTRVPFELQVTPIHEVQIEEELFQFSLGACGTAEANSNRACRSEFKSAAATIKPKRESREINREKATTIENCNFISCLVTTQGFVPSFELNCSSSFPDLVSKDTSC